MSAWIADPGNIAFVAVEEHKIAGVGCMTKAGAITLNYVSPDFRFRGVSKALLAQMERKAAELGLAECRLDSTRTAERLYRAAGFRDAPVSGARCGASPCTTMVKNLSQATAR